MPIYLGSRYETATVVQAQDSSGNYYPVAFRNGSPFPTSTQYQYYLCLQGDRIDRLAYHFYQRSDLWWVIADANPEVPLPEPLVPGTVLRIPNGRDIR